MTTFTIKFPDHNSNVVVGLISTRALAGRVMDIPRKAGADWRGVTVTYQDGQEVLSERFIGEVRRILNPALITVERTEVQPTEDPWAEYERLLKNHDWTFEMSDDHRVWEAGRAAQERLIRLKELLCTVNKERAMEMWRLYAK